MLGSRNCTSATNRLRFFGQTIFRPQIHAGVCVIQAYVHFHFILRLPSRDHVYVNHEVIGLSVICKVSGQSDDLLHHCLGRRKLVTQRSFKVCFSSFSCEQIQVEFMEGCVYSEELWAEQRLCQSTGHGPYQRGLETSLSLQLWVLLHSRATKAEALAAYCKARRHSLTLLLTDEWEKLQKDATYLSLSLGGPEEPDGGVGPVVSGLSSKKPAPKLVIWMGPCYEQKNTGSISKHPYLNPALKLQNEFKVTNAATMKSLPQVWQYWQMSQPHWKMPKADRYHLCYFWHSSLMIKRHPSITGIIVMLTQLLG